MLTKHFPAHIRVSWYHHHPSLIAGSPESHNGSVELSQSLVELVGISVVPWLLWKPPPTNKYLDKDEEQPPLEDVCILFNAESI